MEALLGPEELRCFRALQGREQRHAVDVLVHLQAHGSPSHDLLVAALLHNAGKGPLHLYERVAYTLLAMFTPALLDRIAAPDGLRVPARDGGAARSPGARRRGPRGDRRAPARA